MSAPLEAWFRAPFFFSPAARRLLSVNLDGRHTRFWIEQPSLRENSDFQSVFWWADHIEQFSVGLSQSIMKNRAKIQANAQASGETQSKTALDERPTRMANGALANLVGGMRLATAANTDDVARRYLACELRRGHAMRRGEAQGEARFGSPAAAWRQSMRFSTVKRRTKPR